VLSDKARLRKKEFLRHRTREALLSREKKKKGDREETFTPREVESCLNRGRFHTVKRGDSKTLWKKEERRTLPSYEKKKS